MIKQVCIALMAGLLTTSSSQALQRTDTEFKIFQFPHDMIPRIDGNIYNVAYRS